SLAGTRRIAVTLRVGERFRAPLGARSWQHRWHWWAGRHGKGTKHDKGKTSASPVVFGALGAAHASVSWQRALRGYPECYGDRRLIRPGVYAGSRGPTNSPSPFMGLLERFRPGSPINGAGFTFIMAAHDPA